MRYSIILLCLLIAKTSKVSCQDQEFTWLKDYKTNIYQKVCRDVPLAEITLQDLIDRRPEPYGWKVPYRSSTDIRCLTEESVSGLANSARTFKRKGRSLTSSKRSTTKGENKEDHFANDHPAASHSLKSPIRSTREGEKKKKHSSKDRPAKSHSSKGRSPKGSPASGRSAQDNSASGRSAQGNSASGRSAQGNSASGRSAQGHSASGRSVQGNSASGRSSHKYSENKRPSKDRLENESSGKSHANRPASGRSANQVKSKGRAGEIAKYSKDTIPTYANCLDLWIQGFNFTSPLVGSDEDRIYFVFGEDGNQADLSCLISSTSDSEFRCTMNNRLRFTYADPDNDVYVLAMCSRSEDVNWYALTGDNPSDEAIEKMFDHIENVLEYPVCLHLKFACEEPDYEEPEQQ